MSLACPCAGDGTPEQDTIMLITVAQSGDGKHVSWFGE